MPRLSDSVGPLIVEGGRVGGMGFGRSAVDDGFAFEAPSFPWGGVAVEGVDEPVEFLVDAALHVGGAGGELLEHAVGYVGDLGDPVHDGFPGDTEPGGELGAQTWRGS